MPVMGRSGGARIAAQLAVPVALGLVIGLVIAFQAGSSNSGINQVPLGTLVRPSPSASISPALANTAVTTVAGNTTCDIIVPANPLSARGLATPYQLTGAGGATPAESGCQMSDAVRLGAFVQATILDPATGALSVYDPLVVTKGIRPAVLPSVPRIPADAVVTIDFGFNGRDLDLVGATPTALAGAHCVSGQAGSAFGPVSFCNGTGCFNAVEQDERRSLVDDALEREWVGLAGGDDESVEAVSEEVVDLRLLEGGVAVGGRDDEEEVLLAERGGERFGDLAEEGWTRSGTTRPTSSLWPVTRERAMRLGR